MGKLLASDVIQYGERQIVPMCSVVSEDTLRDAQFIGGECKPRVVMPLYSAITIENRACSTGVSSPARLTPVSDERHTTSVDCIGLYQIRVCLRYMEMPQERLLDRRRRHKWKLSGI